MLLSDFVIKQKTATVVHEDNAACISLSRGEGKFLQSKHTDMRYHYLKENIAEGEIILQDININEQLADILTNPLSVHKSS